MTLQDISALRLISQKIAATEFTTPEEIVGWMGAMQAQDYAMAKWAIGLRLLNATDETVEDAYNRGAILRTHVMRPTWHFVSANDIYWMLNLTADKIKASTNSRHRNLELTPALLNNTNSLIHKALSGGRNLTRDELKRIFEEAGIKTGGNRLSHLMFWAELNGIVCSGPVTGNKLTYALLTERVPQKKTLTRDESLAELAKRYFTSHGPATLQDFTWWSGLAVADARKALEFVQSGFIFEFIGSEKYWFSGSVNGITQKDASVYLLPAYDEFLISYRDRSASLPVKNTNRTVSNNGIFYPIVVANSQVKGLWKRTQKKDKLRIETEFFKDPSKITKKQLIKAVNNYGHFVGIAAFQ